MSSSPQRLAGFSLIEMIIAIVIIGVGLAGVLTAFSTTVRSSADPMLRKQMLSIAEEMLEEILLKPISPGPGTISGCNRSAADNVEDYGGYNQPVCDIDGTAVTGLSGYNVAVVIDAAASLTDGTTVVASGNTLKVSVTVTRGAETLSLSGWRTKYAGP